MGSLSGKSFIHYNPERIDYSLSKEEILIVEVRDEVPTVEVQLERETTQRIEDLEKRMQSILIRLMCIFHDMAILSASLAGMQAFQGDCNSRIWRF